MANTELFLNVDVSSKFNDFKDGHQVIHVETHPDSYYIIGACFSIKGEQRLGDDRKYYEKVTISNLVLRNLAGKRQKIVNARIEYKAGFDYHFVIDLEEDTNGPIESTLKPKKLAFRRCVTNSSFDVTINSALCKLKPKEIDRVGPKICQFRSA